jgi:indole-3-glycerol phosphate synthase
MAVRTILDEIMDWKRQEVARQKGARPLAAVREDLAGAPPPLDLLAALNGRGSGRVRLIAEIKRASPSKGLLCPGLDAAALAGEYEANGAAAISVLTDEHFFQGSLDDLRAVRRQVRLPLLRKDFIFDPYQVYEARAAGADAVLLIVAALDDGDLAALYRLVRELGMAALVEAHDAAELARALRLGPRLVGINNRDLRTFEVHLETTIRLRPLLPAGVTLVAESGVRTRADVDRLAAAGVDAVLVGEALVRAGHTGAASMSGAAGRRVRELVR